MAVCADPLAAAAARDALRQGGSAIDAAIAAQLVLGLVEPQSSGLGGGAFIVHWDAARKEVKTYDARETAPAAARPDRFFRNSARMSFLSAVGSGLSVGVPGVVRGMETAHRRHGKLRWARLFEPAIKLAEDGFPISQRLSALLVAEGSENFSPAARAYFFDSSGKVHPPGFVRTNPVYAATLRAIAAGGADAFYNGPIAESIVAAAAGEPTAKGDLTSADLSRYTPKERAALCFSYRAKKICGMGPPSSGALTIGQTLKLIEPLEPLISNEL